MKSGEIGPFEAGRESGQSLAEYQSALAAANRKIGELLSKAGPNDTAERARLTDLSIKIDADTTQATAKIHTLLTDLGEIGHVAQESLTNGLAENLTQVELGAKSASEALRGLARGFTEAILSEVNRRIAAALVSGLVELIGGLIRGATRASAEATGAAISRAATGIMAAGYATLAGTEAAAASIVIAAAAGPEAVLAAIAASPATAATVASSVGTAAAAGGAAAALNTGGVVPGDTSGPDRDSVLIHATPGEPVINRGAARHYGYDLFDALNKRKVDPKVADTLRRYGNRMMGRREPSAAGAVAAMQEATGGRSVAGSLAGVGETAVAASSAADAAQRAAESAADAASRPGISFISQEHYEAALKSALHNNVRLMKEAGTKAGFIRKGP